MELSSSKILFLTVIVGVLLMKPRKAWTTPAAGMLYDEAFRMAEMYNDLPAGILSRMAYQESRYNPLAESPAGAVGLMQFMPATWREWGRGGSIYDPHAQIAAAGRYLRWLYDRTDSWPLALAAYNWGIGNVTRKGMGEAPRETRLYVAQIGEDVGLI